MAFCLFAFHNEIIDTNLVFLFQRRNRKDSAEYDNIDWKRTVLFARKKREKGCSDHRALLVVLLHLK